MANGGAPSKLSYREAWTRFTRNARLRLTFAHAPIVPPRKAGPWLKFFSRHPSSAVVGMDAAAGGTR